LLGWVGGGHHNHTVRQRQISDHPLQDNSQEGGLNRRWSGRDLIQEQQAPTERGQATSPAWRSEPDLVIDNYWQTSKV
jgi:hypothetical protein